MIEYTYSMMSMFLICELKFILIDCPDFINKSLSF